jgi:p-cumate 2,3-dioxygenase alpha subunit
LKIWNLFKINNGEEAIMTTAKPWIIEDKTLNKFLVNRNTFIDKEILKLERERIFDRVWIYVGHESEIPNPHDYVTRKVAGKSIIFTRDAEGKVHVLLNTCTHRGALVCREEKGNTKTFLCCYHAWSFKNDGELIGVPHAAAYGDKFDRKSLNMVDARRFPWCSERIFRFGSRPIS